MLQLLINIQAFALLIYAPMLDRCFTMYIKCGFCLRGLSNRSHALNIFWFLFPSFDKSQRKDSLIIAVVFYRIISDGFSVEPLFDG